MNYIFCCWNNTKDKKRNINMNAHVYKGTKMYLKRQKNKKKKKRKLVVWSQDWEKKSSYTHPKLQVEFLDKKKLIIQAGTGPGHCLFLYYTTLSCLNMLVSNWDREHNAERNFPLRAWASQHPPSRSLVWLSWDIMHFNVFFLRPRWPQDPVSDWTVIFKNRCPSCSCTHLC